MEEVSVVGITENCRDDAEQLFELFEEIGRGAYGCVYRARDRYDGTLFCRRLLTTSTLFSHRRTDEIVAVKKVPLRSSPEVLKKLENEVQLLKRVSSCAYVTTYLGTYSSRFHLWIVLELMALGSLKMMMDVMGAPLSEVEVAVVCRHVLHGLSFLHELRLVHRDIKADNILLSHDGVAKIADFGVSGTVDDFSKRSTATGSTYWMAPEVTWEKEQTELADVWSLGITAIELAQQVPPFFELLPLRAVFMIATEGNPLPFFSKPARFSFTFQRFVRRCVQRMPAQRPSAAELLGDDRFVQVESFSRRELVLRVLAHRYASLLEAHREQERKSEAARQQELASMLARLDADVDAERLHAEEAADEVAARSTPATASANLSSLNSSAPPTSDVSSGASVASSSTLSQTAPVARRQRQSSLVVGRDGSATTAAGSSALRDMRTSRDDLDAPTSPPPPMRRSDEPPRSVARDLLTASGNTPSAVHAATSLAAAGSNINSSSWRKSFTTRFLNQSPVGGSPTRRDTAGTAASSSGASVDFGDDDHDDDDDDGSDSTDMLDDFVVVERSDNDDDGGAAAAAAAELVRRRTASGTMAHSTPDLPRPQEHTVVSESDDDESNLPAATALPPSVTVTQLVAMLRDSATGLPIADRQVRFNMYYSAFSGEEFCSWIMQQPRLRCQSRADAAAVGLALIYRGVIAACGRKNTFLDKSSALYQFTADERARSHAVQNAEELLGAAKDVRVDRLVARMRHPVTGVPVGDQKRFLWSFKQCFAGATLVSWLLFQHIGLQSRSEAVRLAQLLMRRGVFYPISQSDRSAFRDSTGTFYRFYLDDATYREQHRAPTWFGRSAGDDTDEEGDNGIASMSRLAMSRSMDDVM